MSLFGSLFGGKKQYKEDKEFTLLFNDTMRRYLSSPNAELEFTFNDKKGNPMPPSVAFVGAYRECQKIQSIWDKRSTIFRSLDKKFINNLKKWQIIERFTIDRYPEKALEFIEKYGEEDDLKNADFLTAHAKCLFILTQYEESIKYAKEALSIDPDMKKAKVVLADSLHLSGQHDEAHEIYRDVMNESSFESNDDVEISVTEVVNFQNQILHSSVYAAGLLSNDEVDQRYWDEVAEEFYFCPYFRTRHAFSLVKSGDHLRALAKLVSITQEFPFFKEAIINTQSIILQMREQLQDDTICEDDLQRVNQIILENSWEDDAEPIENPAEKEPFQNLTEEEIRASLADVEKKRIMLAEVRTNMTSDREADTENAFRAAEITSEDLQKQLLQSYTWHYLDDMDEEFKCTMQLVLTEVLEATKPFVDSRTIYRKVFGFGYPELDDDE